ncbi:MAG: GyrI-like domain-containing protein [Deltaproteobacteria bacterium]|nr:GyrI-like domain-containing protein [Deltaproteobacteria bacterium]
MRHRNPVDELGSVQIDRGLTGGIAPAWSVADAPEMDAISRDFAASRVVGIRHHGPLTFDGLRRVSEKLQVRRKEKGLRVVGPTISVLEANPYEVEPAKRDYFTCFPIAGPVEAMTGIVLRTLPGGMHVLVASSGALADLEKCFAFLFGRFLRSRGYEIARPDEPQIRQIYLRPPHECSSEDDLVTQIAVPVAPLMRTDTLGNQR